jgi:hypothetical protein
MLKKIALLAGLFAGALVQADGQLVDQEAIASVQKDENAHNEFLALVMQEIVKADGALTVEKAEQLAMQFYGSKKENKAFTAGMLTGVVAVALGYAAWYVYNKYHVHADSDCDHFHGELAEDV